MYLKFFKPLFDRSIALVAFGSLLVIFIPLTILLFFANRGKPFFVQCRPGKKGKIFNVIKFKTMNDRTNLSGALLPDAVRLTALGRFVRRTSLDEIPQLLNVIKGDMSLVGPRPLLVEYLPLYNNEQSRRHEVSPGITGWAQVNGRNAISWEKKFEYDVWYVDHVSFGLDLRIIGMTLIKMFKSDGVSAAGHATMKKFEGT